jgi:hypothetical protein
MKRAMLFMAGTALALGGSGLALAAPEDLLPPGFGSPPPAAPAPAPSATRSASTASPAAPSAPQAGAPSGSAPVVQPLPGGAAAGAPVGDQPVRIGGITLPANFPTLAELDAMDPDEIDEVLGLTPKFDIPAGARRSVEEVGLLSAREGGFARNGLARQPAALVRAALRASDGPLVSRWGHILMRRLLTSRLNAPEGMDPVEFAGLRARALNAMGEGIVARAFVQDVDGSNYDRTLTDAAFDAYVGTGDLLGICPVARLKPTIREDAPWEMAQQICAAFVGEGREADRRLQRILGTSDTPEIDVRLAQRFAGAGGEGRRAVNIEWDGVEGMTPWRLSLARTLGVDIPANLLGGESSAQFDLIEVAIPASPLLERVEAAERAGARGVLSSAAMVDLYSQFYASDQYSNEQKAEARQLREAYVAENIAQRIEALRSLWGTDGSYGKQVLTAYAAARLPVNEAYAADAPRLIAAMLAAGLDRNALRWGNVVAEGSEGWALLALAQPERLSPVDSGAFGSFASNDESEGSRKAQFLLAGLAGLGRMEADDVTSAAEDLGVNLARESAWSRKITLAARGNNRALVALLAGMGMQGTGWDRMTARQLYVIVRSLNQVGLAAEARMIAAEAVARG